MTPWSDMAILEKQKSLVVRRECRYKVAFLKTSEEHIYDTVERLVDAEIQRLGLEIPPMPEDY